MTAFTRTPLSTDLLQPTKFILTFGRIDTVQYFCQSVNIPGISINKAQISTMMENLYAPGNKMEYNELKMKFLVDEKLLGWQQLHGWFRSIASPEGFAERKKLTSINNKSMNTKPSYYSDATLTVMSALNNPIIRIQYFNVFPTSLSDIEFNTTLSAEKPIVADATFNFDYYNFVSA